MPTEPVFDNIVLEKKITDLKTVVKTETETDVATESVSKVLSLSAFAAVTEHSKTDNALSFSGKAVFYLCYRDAEGKIKKTERAGVFSGFLPVESLAESDYPIFSCAVDKTDWLADGERFSVSAYISVCAKVRAQRDESFLSGGEGLFLNRVETEYDKSFGVKKGAFSSDEEFDLNYPVSEVLSQTVKTRVTAVQCGVGTIIVDGEVFLSLLCLQKAENGGIIRENKVVSFRTELEYEDAMPSMSAVADVTLSSYKTDVSVDGEEGKSTVSFTAALSVEGEAFSKETAVFADDVFSPTDEIENVAFDATLISGRGSAYFFQRVAGRTDAEGMPDKYEISAACCEKIEITDYSAENGVVRAEGVLSALLVVNEEGKITSRKKETPVVFSFECDIPEGAKAEVTAFATAAEAQLLSGGIELSADISVRVDYRAEREIRFVKDVKVTGVKVAPDAAISVYIPVRGENLWSLSKRLSVCPEELVAANRDLQFPLTGNERIVVYRQK